MSEGTEMPPRRNLAEWGHDWYLLNMNHRCRGDISYEQPRGPQPEVYKLTNATLAQLETQNYYLQK